ncbi:alanine/glycine:cation symporter family protein [Cytophagaceae bacterium ABcell3]|nr:alanine/glycine:cation symporter family protein [Cytophagaceae bacterium ABcell3]
MKITLRTLFVFVIFSVSTIFLLKAEENQENLLFVNEANYKVSIFLGLEGEGQYPDTLLPEHRPAFYHLQGGESLNISSGDGWQNVLSELPHNTLSIYVLSTDTLVNYSWDDIREGYNILKRIDVGLDELEATGYTVYFPEELTLDERINRALGPVTALVSTIVFFPASPDNHKAPFVLFWLVGAAIFFTIFMKFINIRSFGHAIAIVRGVYDNPNDEGEVNHFQALATALSGTVGLGNIAGVAVAISLGGPGATLWMVLAGFLGMTSKFLECTLGVKYRIENPDGSVSGGPMYYLRKGLAKRGWVVTGRVLAAFFAIMCVGGSLGGGNMFQGNQAARQVINITGGENSIFAGSAWIIGIIMAILVALVIIGGIKSIARVTEKIVPFMCGIYVLGALAVLVVNFNILPETVMTILRGAFQPDAAYGGVVGVLIMGFKRAAFSNEAGIGSASIAHSAVKTNEPVSEGIVALLEPFIDTVVICSISALAIVSTGQYLDVAGSDTTVGISLTSAAFETVIWWFPFVLSIAVILFAFSTMLSWSYYGLKSWTYLFGPSKASDYSYKFIFCLFIVIGSSMSLGNVIEFSDAMIFAMSFPNILGMYILAPEVKRDLQYYFHRIKTGEIKRYK